MQCARKWHAGADSWEAWENEVLWCNNIMSIAAYDNSVMHEEKKKSSIQNFNFTFLSGQMFELRPKNSQSQLSGGSHVVVTSQNLQAFRHNVGSLNIQRKQSVALAIPLRSAREHSKPREHQREVVHKISKNELSGSSGSQSKTVHLQ